jgi:hypothetical protein
MSVQMVGVDTLGAAKIDHRQLATRVIAKAVSIAAGIAHKIADEVVYTIREDFRHGQISRDPEDWER